MEFDNNTFVIGGQPVGKDHPPLFLPEIGCYFGKDVGKAKNSIDNVIKAGFPLIKGEVCHDASYVLDCDLQYNYNSFRGLKNIRYRDLIESLVLPLATWYQLYEYVHDQGVRSVISAYDKKSIDFIADVGGSCVKLASNNINNLPLIRHASRKSLPVMFDTGKASLSEVAKAVEEALDNGSPSIFVNHNPDGHPAPAEDHNLRIVDTYRNAFNCPIGISDHYQGELMVYAAAALNYDIIEKPCVDIPEDIDIESLWAMPFDSMSEVRENILQIWTALGNTRRAGECRQANHEQRMGLTAARAIQVGETIHDQNTGNAYPCLGISVRDWDVVKGFTVIKHIAEGQPISWSDVRPISKT